MSVKQITTDDLRKMKGTEGLILQGCGGSLDEWVDGINDMLTESGILLGGTKFKAENCCVFENEGLTNLLFPFSEDVKLDMGRLAMWRLQTHENFGGTWLSDYVDNRLGGFIPDETAERKNSVIMLGRLSLNNLTFLTAFTVEENHPVLFAEDGVLYSKDKTKLLYFPCAKNISRYTVLESVTELGESCFGLCSTLTDIYVGNQVTVIDSGIFGNMKRPFVHTPAGSAMEQFCAANNIPYDNVMQ